MDRQARQRREERREEELSSFDRSTLAGETENRFARFHFAVTLPQIMSAEIQFTLNGQPKTISTDAERPLLEVLREDLGLTGTKYGCGEGACRACTVLVDGKAMQSCLLPASAAKGKKIETIEGLSSNGGLHPVQQAFLQEQAMQCGYCVPGMIMSTVALLRNNSSPTRAQIIEGLNGNLCRCCGYPNIVKAVESASKLLAKK
jgi:aerobic-type carbon monoxide dehydrogenase small subunit (CoxS/CutS family)